MAVAGRRGAPRRGLQTSRIRQIQLTRAEPKESAPPRLALPFSFDRLSPSLLLTPSNPTTTFSPSFLLFSSRRHCTRIHPLRVLAASTTHGLPDVRSEREISKGEERERELSRNSLDPAAPNCVRTCACGRKRGRKGKWVSGGRDIRGETFLNRSDSLDERRGG